MLKKIIFAFLVAFSLSVSLTSVHADSVSTDKFVKEAENKNFVLYVNPKSLAIQIENKNSGYIWDSSLKNLSNQGLNTSWQQFVSSAITIDYINNFNKQRTANVANGAQVTLLKEANGFRANIHFRMAGIGMVLVVKLTDTGFEVQVPHDSITESQLGKLVDLSLYPFLGATKLSETQGYMLIPDGSGAIISYQDPTKMTSAYQQNYYGDDYGIQETNNTGQALTLPVYGIVNGNNALLSYVKSGAEYGQLNATKAGLQTNFNWITSKFTYRAQYNQPTSEAQAGAGVQMYQKKANPVNIDIKFDLISGDEANYTGLAKALQNELVSEGILHKRKTTQSNPSIMQLDFLGSDQKPGIFWSQLAVFTPVSFIEEQMKSLNLNQITFGLDGFTKGGFSNSQPNPFPIEPKVGSKSDYQKLIKTSQSTDNPFALDIGYSINPKLGKKAKDIKTTNVLQQINGFNFNALQPNAYPELAQRDVKDYQSLGIKQINIYGLGQNLDSNYSGKGTNRTQAMKEQEKAFEILKKAGLTLSANQPNLYAWKYLTNIYGLPNSDSYYIYETQSVPFVQNVLKGYINYYSDYANDASDATVYKLQNIMTGSFPSYVLTKSDSSTLQKTNYQNYYNTTFNNWKTKLKSDYQDYKKVADSTQNATITNQESLTTDGKVMETTYSNGTVILTNLSTKNFTDKNWSVSKMSYHIIKKGE